QCTPFRRYKTWTYEGGISTPMIVRWPGKVQAGEIRGEMGHVIDLLPTCLELAGGKYPHRRGERAILPVEGRSLVGMWRGEACSPHDRLYWELYGSRAVRSVDWKLVWGVTAEKW